MYQLLALRTAEKVGDSSIQMCMINNDIAQTFLSLSEHQKAMFYYEKALAVAEKHNDHKAIYITGSLIATAWTKLKKPLVAVQVLNKLSKYKKPDDLTIDGIIARSYIRSYCMLKEYKKAEPYCEQLLNFVRTLDMNDYSAIQCYAEAIWFYIHSGQYGLAAKYLRKHQALTEKVSDLEQMANSHKLWFMLDTSRHNYRSAVDHLVAHKHFQDSLFTQAKSRQIEELQVQYETEKKEKDILLKDQNIGLLTKQSQLQGAMIKNERLTRNAIITGAALLLLVLILVYSRYVQKRKSNKVVLQKNEQLEHLLTEKEWLLKEIHHRVKNNLQIVMSLLNSQSAYIENEPALVAIHDSQHRVHAMSLIHQKLYGSGNLSSIDMSVYIRELVLYLSDSFNTGQRIRFEYDVEPIEMDVSEAVPLGLILNEAITNAIKYAFPDGRRGVISVTLSTTTHGRYLLCISDDGIGVSTPVNNKKPGTLGMSLMQGLSEDLDAELSIQNNNGTTVSISFEQEHRAKRFGTLASTSVHSN
jgi:two-component sensor histidine kinase